MLHIFLLPFSHFPFFYDHYHLYMTAQREAKALKSGRKHGERVETKELNCHSLIIRESSRLLFHGRALSPAFMRHII